MRRRARPGNAKGETRQPAVRTSPKKEAARGDELEKRLAEALEQRKATSEILRVISSSLLLGAARHDGCRNRTRKVERE
jgi:hypothetical protein